MSSKAKKASSTAGGGQSGSPRVSTSSKKSATPTPQKASPQNVSSLAHSRLHEKAELANLNDRLACYIDRVRHLESENNRLTREIRTSQETTTKEVTGVKAMYEQEINDVRKLLDDMSKEKAKIEVDIRRLYVENDELKSNLDKRNKEFNSIQNSLNLAEGQLLELTPKYQQAQQERKKLNLECKALDKEVSKLNALLAETKKQLEEETISRIDMENKLQSSREELLFKEQVHQQILTECRTKKQVEISEIDGRLAQEYEERLYHSLQEIREQYEIDLENNKEETQKMWDEKIRSLSSQLSRTTNAATMAMEERRQAQIRVDELNKKVNELQTQEMLSNQRARDLEKQLESTKTQYINEFSKYDAEITRLREEMAQRVQDYQDLMDIKVALDIEIAAYRKLLEGEESRLNITPVVSPSARPTPSRSARASKRRRVNYEESEEISSTDYEVTSSSKGEIEVSKVCPEGGFVEITNKGNKGISLSGWQVVRKAGNDTTLFKFHRSTKIEPGATVTVYSSDTTNQAHDPPSHIVMKTQKWVIGDTMLTQVVNPDGEEVATAEHKKQLRSSMISHSGAGFYPGSYRERLHKGDAAAARGDERCSIM